MCLAVVCVEAGFSQIWSQIILALLVSCQGESTIIGGNIPTLAQVSTVVPVEIDTLLNLKINGFISFSFLVV